MKLKNIITNKIFIAENAAEQFYKFVCEHFNDKDGTKGCMICDFNTGQVAHNYIEEGYPCYQGVGLPINSHHAEENMIECANDAVKDMNVDYFIACGAGTIHDITRVIAHRYNKPFISFPTAASVDGFVSSVAPITTDSGMKITLPSVAPVALFADINALAEAPRRLTASGVGDLIGKYISLADWRIANLLLGEEMDNEIVSNMYKAVNSVVNIDISDYKNFCAELLDALVLSGICMQSVGNSRPASGAEHHIAHFLEMDILEKNNYLHGENVAAGAILCAELYHKFASSENIKFIENYALDENLIKQYYVDLSGIIIEENSPEYLHKITPKIFYDNLAAIREIIKDIPPVHELERILSHAEINMPVIGDANTKELILKLAPYVRNRFTLLKLCRCLEF